MSGASGLIAAAITPRNKNEEIDFGAAFELIDFLCRGGVDGIALFTALGEYPSLAADERSRLLYLAVKRSRRPLWVGVGAATLHASLCLAHEAQDAGASAILLPPPHFFKYDQDDLREFYLQFAARIDRSVPLYIVNTPEYSSAIAPGTLGELLATGHFAGLADSISESACAAPELAAMQRSNAAAARAQMDLFTAWSRQFPATVALKQALQLRGLKTGTLPSPLPAAKRAQLERFGKWFQYWLADFKKIATYA